MGAPRYRIEMEFFGSDDRQLDRVVFYCPNQDTPIVSRRGRNPDSCAVNSFQWSKAVRALSVVVLGTLARQYSSARGEAFILSGGQGSPASSLDFAIAKSPQWLMDMFGVDREGTALIKKFVWRNNPERKRPGPVELFIPPSRMWDLEIVAKWNGDELKEEKAAEFLASLGEELGVSAGEEVMGSVREKTRIRGRNEDFFRELGTELLFREEWLAIVHSVVSQTTNKLNGMVFNGEIGQWWKSVAGSAYLLTNMRLIEEGKKIRRLYIPIVNEFSRIYPLC